MMFFKDIVYTSINKVFDNYKHYGIIPMQVMLTDKHDKYVTEIVISYIEEYVYNSNRCRVSRAYINPSDGAVIEKPFVSWVFHLLVSLRLNPEQGIILDYPEDPVSLIDMVSDDIVTEMDDKITFALPEAGDKSVTLVVSSHHLIVGMDGRSSRSKEKVTYYSDIALAKFKKLIKRNDRTKALWDEIVQLNEQLDNEEAEMRLLDKLDNKHRLLSQMYGVVIPSQPRLYNPKLDLSHRKLALRSSINYPEVDDKSLDLPKLLRGASIHVNAKS